MVNDSISPSHIRCILLSLFIRWTQHKNLCLECNSFSLKHFLWENYVCGHSAAKTSTHEYKYQPKIEWKKNSYWAHKLCTFAWDGNFIIDVNRIFYFFFTLCQCDMHASYSIHVYRKWNEFHFFFSLFLRLCLDWFFYVMSMIQWCIHMADELNETQMGIFFAMEIVIWSECL